MTNNLTEINCNDLLILRDLYKSNGPKRYIGYMTLNNYAQWLEKDPNVKHIHIYCLNGDFTDGTFVLTVSVYCNLILFCSF